MSEPRTLPLVVEAVEDLTPHMRRIQLRGPSLEAFEYFPGQDLALGIVRDDGSIVRRRYTIRRFDPGKRLVDLDVVMHGDGPGIRWAQAARPGLPIEAIGPRGKIGLDPTAKWHLFAGDATGLPGAFAMMETLPRAVRAGAYFTFSRSVRISSTLVLEAASISITSTGAPETKSWQEGQAPQASGPVRAVHASALASNRAVVVLPTPRGPVNRYACATRPEASAFCKVRVTASCPTTPAKTCGRHFRANT